MVANTEEVLRYLGAGDSAPEALRRQVSAAARQLSAEIQPRYVYKVFDLMRSGEEILLSGTEIRLSGRMCRTMLAQCNKAVLLACTLGLRFDSMLRAAQARDMAHASILNACGSALAECGCDAAEQEIATRFPNHFLTDRFSPGYGDLPLSLQPAICSALDAQRRLGIHVSEQFLMNPWKSVTAVIGISDRPQMARIRGCDYCAMQETCTLRKGGTRCGI